MKANAYGLGVERVATSLADAGCKTFFVAALAEALELRALLPSVTIYVFSGVDAQSAPILRSNAIHPVLNTLEQIQLWAATAPPCGAAIHVDTGMNRLGLSAEEAATLQANPDLLRSCGAALLMTHLACADTPPHTLNAQQHSRFAALAKAFPQLKTSISNSAGALNTAKGNDIARPGIGLYGGNPRPAMDMALKPVITLTAPILQIRTITAGESVGYGASFTAQHPMQTATVGIGYADGMMRAMSGKGYAYVGGKACPVLGRISMDSLVIDVTDASGAQVGGEAELLGRTTVNDMAHWAGTISYEILTGLGARIKRRYINA